MAINTATSLLLFTSLYLLIAEGKEVLIATPSKNQPIRVNKQTDGQLQTSASSAKEPTVAATELGSIQVPLLSNSQRGVDLYASGEGHPHFDHAGRPLNLDYNNIHQNGYAPYPHHREYSLPPVHYGSQYLGRRSGGYGHHYPADYSYPYGYDGLNYHDPRMLQRVDPYAVPYGQLGYPIRSTPYDLYNYGSQNSLSYGRSPYYPNSGYYPGDDRINNYRTPNAFYPYHDYSGNEYGRRVSPYLYHRGGNYQNIDVNPPHLLSSGAQPQGYGLPTNGNPGLNHHARFGQPSYEDQQQRLYGSESGIANKELENKQTQINGPASSGQPIQNYNVDQGRVAQLPLGQTRFGVRRRFDRTLNRLYNAQEQAYPENTANTRDEVK